MNHIVLLGGFSITPTSPVTRPTRARSTRLSCSRLPLAVCTIYEPRFPEPVLRRLAATALTALNDVITREAFARGVDCIDLRIVCDEDADFANPIEPSVRGGAKIAQAILGFAAGDAANTPRVITR